MTRWKQSETMPLYIMHRHNQRSVWHAALERACTALDVPLSSRWFLAGDDTYSQEIYVSASALARIGGLEELHRCATIIHEKMMGV